MATTYGFIFPPNRRLLMRAGKGPPPRRSSAVSASPPRASSGAHARARARVQRGRTPRQHICPAQATQRPTHTHKTLSHHALYSQRVAQAATATAAAGLGTQQADHLELLGGPAAKASPSPPPRVIIQLLVSVLSTALAREARGGAGEKPIFLLAAATGPFFPRPLVRYT